MLEAISKRVAKYTVHNNVLLFIVCNYYLRLHVFRCRLSARTCGRFELWLNPRSVMFPSMALLTLSLSRNSAIWTVTSLRSISLPVSSTQFSFTH